MKRSPEFDVSWSFDFTWDKMDKNKSKLQTSSQLLVVSARFYPPAESPGYGFTGKDECELWMLWTCWIGVSTLAQIFLISRFHRKSPNSH